MAITNIFEPFSESVSGMPIVVSTVASPGTLIHSSELEADSLWVWASLADSVSYLDAVYLRVLKGNASLGYVEDSLVKLSSGLKVIIESGVIITGNVEYRIYIDSELSTLSTIPNISISGYVHRRI